MITVSGGVDTARYYYHYDGLGSVIGLSNSAGAFVERYEYDAFGVCTVHTGAWTDGIWMTADDTLSTQSAKSNPFLFTGRQYDPETGLYYYRARMYSPSLGRFLQTDPIGYADSMNLYGYCGNNPTTFLDPMGLKLMYNGDEKSVQEAITYLSKSPTFQDTFNYLEKLQDIYVISTNNESDDSFDIGIAREYGLNNINWDPSMALRFKSGTISPALSLAHEMEHARNYAEGDTKHDEKIGGKWTTLEEKNVILKFENHVAQELGESRRHSHTGNKPFQVSSSTSRKECKKSTWGSFVGWLKSIF